jgi:hypothetical protein
MVLKKENKGRRGARNEPLARKTPLKLWRNTSLEVLQYFISFLPNAARIARKSLSNGCINISTQPTISGAAANKEAHG